MAIINSRANSPATATPPRNNRGSLLLQSRERERWDRSRRRLLGRRRDIKGRHHFDKLYWIKDTHTLRVVVVVVDIVLPLPILPSRTARRSLSLSHLLSHSLIDRPVVSAGSAQPSSPSLSLSLSACRKRMGEGRKPLPGCCLVLGQHSRVCFE